MLRDFCRNCRNIRWCNWWVSPIRMRPWGRSTQQNFIWTKDLLPSEEAMIEATHPQAVLVLHLDCRPPARRLEVAARHTSP